MKLNRYFALFTVILGVSVASQIQAQSTKKLLTRAWSISFEETLKYLPAKEKKMFDKMSPDERRAIKQKMEESYLDFKSDGTCETYMDNTKERVSWELAANGKTLKMSDASGADDATVEILKLTKDRFIARFVSEVESVVEGEKEEVALTMVFVPKK